MLLDLRSWMGVTWLHLRENENNTSMLFNINMDNYRFIRVITNIGLRYENSSLLQR